MAAKKIALIWSETGKTVYVIVRRDSDGFLLDDIDGIFKAVPTDAYLPLAEDAFINGLYETSEARSVWLDGQYLVSAYDQVGVSPIPATDNRIGGEKMYVLSDAEVVLDAPVSSRSTLTAQQVWEYVDRQLTSFGTLIASIWAYVSRRLTSAWTDELPSRDMAAIGSVGMSQATITIYRTASVIPIDGVFVAIYNTTETVLIASGVTNISGQLVVNLDDATYKIRFRKTGVTFAVSETMVVLGATSVTYYGTVWVSPTLPVPGLQILYGFVYNLDGSPAIGKEVTVTVRQDQIVAGAVLSKIKFSDKTDATGYFEVVVICGSYITLEVEDFYMLDINVTNDPTRDVRDYL